MEDTPISPQFNPESAPRTLMSSLDLRPLAVACVTSPLPDDVAADFAQAFNATFASPEKYAQTLADGDFDALLITVDVRLGASEIAALPAGIKAVATYSVGL